MSTLVLVRHAQASFFEADYDLLSPTGEEQALELGLHWAGQALAFDAVYTGPKARHGRTASIVGEQLAQFGVRLPQPVVLEEFDEHAVDRALRESLSELARAHGQLASLADAYARASTRLEKQRAFQLVFEALTVLWSEGAWELPGVEPWHLFRDKVQAAIRRITADVGHGRRIAVFTSVGPISAALGLVLGCTDRMALELGWRLRNASLTKVVFTSGRMTLDSFNSCPHLLSSELWTYR